LEVIHEYKRFGYWVTLYHDRIEIKDVILLSSVVGVTVSALRRDSKELTLSLTDGSQRNVLVYGKDADKLRQAILRVIQ